MNELLQQVLTDKAKRSSEAATQAAYDVPVGAAWS